MTKVKIANEIVSKKIKVVQEFLMKWTDPKPEFSGMMESLMAMQIIAAIIKVDEESEDDINLGLSAQEEAEALDAIEHENITFGGKGVKRIIDNFSDEKPH